MCSDCVPVCTRVSVHPHSSRRQGRGEGWLSPTLSLPPEGFVGLLSPSATSWLSPTPLSSPRLCRAQDGALVAGTPPRASLVPPTSGGPSLRRPLDFHLTVLAPGWHPGRHHRTQAQLGWEPAPAPRLPLRGSAPSMRWEWGRAQGESQAALAPSVQSSEHVPRGRRFSFRGVPVPGEPWGWGHGGRAGAPWCALKAI